MMIVPDRPNDLSGVVATALGLHAELSDKARVASPTAVGQPRPDSGGPGAAKPTDWVTGR